LDADLSVRIRSHIYELVCKSDRWGVDRRTRFHYLRSNRVPRIPIEQPISVSAELILPNWSQLHTANQTTRRPSPQSRHASWRRRANSGGGTHRSHPVDTRYPPNHFPLRLRSEGVNTGRVRGCLPTIVMRRAPSTSKKARWCSAISGEQFIGPWWRSHPSVCLRSILNRCWMTLTPPCPPNNCGIWARVQRPRQTSNVVTAWLRRDLAPYYVLGIRKWLALLIAWTQGHCCHHLAVVTWTRNPVRWLRPWRYKAAWRGGATHQRSAPTQQRVRAEGLTGRARVSAPNAGDWTEDVELVEGQNVEERPIWLPFLLFVYFSNFISPIFNFQIWTSIKLWSSNFYHQIPNTKISIIYLAYSYSLN
jgi:hypothetical protein